MPLSQSERNLRWRTKHPDRHKANYATWRANNKEKRAADSRKWRAENPKLAAKHYRRSTLKRKYGITPERYAEMLAAQGGHCALCDRTPDQERSGSLCVDHCHDTGRVRGLLCVVHNSALASLGDDEAGLLKAMAYIKGGV